MRHPIFLFLAALFWSFSAGTGAAQTNVLGFALNRFEPSERGSEWFVLDTLDFRGRARPALGVVGDYALKPLVFYDQDGDEAQALVKRQLFVHAGGSLVLVDRLRLGVSLPVAVLIDGESGTIAGQRYEVDEGGGIGDLRLSADVRLFGEYRGPITGALGVSLWLPTGSREAYTGDGKVRVGPHLALAGESGLFAYAMKVGFNYRARAGELGGGELGSELTWAVSAGLRVAEGNLLIGPEVYGSTVLEGDAFREQNTPFEGLLGAHYWIDEVVRVGAGAGTGFTEGFGAPKLRVVGSLEWVPGYRAPTSDRDGDGIADAKDACPDEAGIASDDPAKHGCPVRDRDGDGIRDEDDACPDEAGIASDDPAKHGCPVRDRDQDGILDADDACPDNPGLHSADPVTNGCPDSDGDTILDPRDACPTAAGPRSHDPEKNGCPPARIEKGQIRIREQVQFKTDSAEILVESEPILNAVLAIMNEHPELTKVSIEGHTDNVGTAAYNKGLSQRRAYSVLQWLVRHGIEPARLSSGGFGLEMPIASNETADGRTKNRRVEFHIREVNGVPADNAVEIPGEPADTEEP